MKKSIIYVLLALLAMALGVAVVYCIKQGVDIKSVFDFLKPKTEVLADMTQTCTTEQQAIVDTPEETVAEVAPVEPDPVITQQQVIPTEAPSAPPVENVKVVPVEPELIVDKTACRVEQISESCFRVSGLRAKNAKSSNLTYIISDSEGHRYENNEGSFENVASNEKGTYAVVVKDRANNEKSKAAIIGGFKIVKPIEKLSAAELAAVFNTGSGDSLGPVRDKFAKNCKIISSRHGVSTMSKIFELVNMHDLKVTVTDVCYDATGRITSFNVSFN